MTLNKNQLQVHVISWTLIIIYLNVTGPLTGTWMAKIVGSSLIIINYMFVFYSLSLFVFPKFWEGKRLLLFLCIIIILFTYWFNGHFLFLKIIPAMGGSTVYQKEDFIYFLRSTFYFFVITGSAGVASFFSRYSLYKLKGQTEKEKILLVRELYLYKVQINSEITFNFLNYCYQKIYQQLPETAESIKQFSKMLRYTFQTKPDEKVALSNELIYIEDFISLQKLLSAKVYVEFHYEGDLNNKHVLPRILITFVENAFKHGLGNNPEYPIAINLKVNADHLIFTVRNKINTNKAAASSHTGLENVSQILDLYYPNNYELKKAENDGVFNVELTLVL